jgi:uncharacterized protein with PQ loop repeat
MDFVSLLGSAGTVLGLIRAVPQLIRLMRAREAYGVSLDTAATSSIVSFGWATYGLLSHQPYVVFATGSSGLIFAIITFLAIRFGRSVKEFKVAPLWIFILFLVGLLFGKNGLGVMLPISVLASNIPQLWVAYKERNLRDLSLGTWLLSIGDGLVWGLYALLQHDVSILIYGLFQLITSAPIVLLKILHLASEKELNSDVLSE